MRMIIAASACVALSACATWYKPGASEAEFYQDKGACQAQAMSVYPQAMVTTGGYQAPTQTNCTRIGNTTNCTTTPGQQIQGFTQDQNAIARGFAFNDCMRGRGWTSQ